MRHIEKLAEQRYPYGNHDTFNMIQLDRRTAFIAGANADKWVSVKEPPEKNVKVMVCYMNESIGFARFDGYLWVDDGSYYVAPMFWQPLPLPKPPQP